MTCPCSWASSSSSDSPRSSTGISHPTPSTRGSPTDGSSPSGSPMSSPAPTTASPPSKPGPTDSDTHSRPSSANCDVYVLPVERVRLDSTTSCGYHTVTEDGLMQLGHSKDHRPDLAQFKLMAAVAEP